MQTDQILASTLFCFALTSGLAGQAVPPTPHQPTEYQLRDQWAKAFLCDPSTTSTLSHLEVIEEDVPGGIMRDRSWRSTPFQIGEKTYSHGLAFNASKRLRVYLDRPAKRFTSDVGLENNDDTRRGAEQGSGSVTFHVLVQGKEVFASPVLRLKDGPRPVDVPLQGAREFELRVGDGADGRGWDQALWGEAQIQLEDGSTLRLQDLPFPDPQDVNPSRVSFSLAGKPSSSLLSSWKRQSSSTPLPDSKGSCQEIVFTDPDSGLKLTLTAKLFSDFAAVEWVARLKNTSTKDSPLIENLQALDAAFAVSTTQPASLHWATGGVASFDDFAPRTTPLPAGTRHKIETADGRSSSQYLPFFNLEGAGWGSGVMLALGWSGNWAAQFDTASQGDAVHVLAGQGQTHLVLHPGEEIRTPSMLALFYQGDRWRGHNQLRRFILAHHRPLKDGKPLHAPITNGNWGGTRAEVHLGNISKIISERLPIDYYWIDAGWYGPSQPQPVDTWASNVGYWDVKTNLYPQGFKPLSDLLRKNGRELMLWFEPERVIRDTPWFKEHRQWLLDTGEANLLMNLGNPEACRFVTDFVSSRIDEFGLGCYRQDFNMDPSSYWKKADAPDRQGMAENLYIQGLYAFWDGILSRHSNLIIDNCASGGRRIDLETVGRATPFWRTDGPRDPIAHQCHTYGLLAWVPFSATSQDREGDDYEFRSSMCSGLCINWEHSGDGPVEPNHDSFPYDWARHTLEQYKSIRDFYYGDYYPLTQYSQAADVWMAYQMDRPETGQGLVVVLRRPQSPYETAHFALHALDSQATYVVKNLDTNAETRLSGAELVQKGLPVSIAAQPGSALITYTKAQ